MISKEGSLQTIFGSCFCLSYDKQKEEPPLSEQIKDVKKAIEIIENKIAEQNEEVRRGLENMKEHVTVIQQKVDINMSNEEEIIDYTRYLSFEC